MLFVSFECWSKVKGCRNSCVAERRGKRSHNILDPSSLWTGKSLGVEFVSDWQAKSSCCRCFESPDVGYRSPRTWTWTETENDLIYFWCFMCILGQALRVFSLENDGGAVFLYWFCVLLLLYINVWWIVFVFPQEIELGYKPGAAAYP